MLPIDENQPAAADMTAARRQRAAASIASRCEKLRDLTAAHPEEQAQLLALREHVRPEGPYFFQLRLIKHAG